MESVADNVAAVMLSGMEAAAAMLLSSPIFEIIIVVAAVTVLGTGYVRHTRRERDAVRRRLGLPVNELDRKAA